MIPEDFQALADRMLIRELIDDYSNRVTRKDVAGLGDLFVEDCSWRTQGTIPREFHGRDQVVGAITAVVEGYPFIFQMPHAPIIAIDGDAARVTTLMHEIGQVDGETMAWAIAVYQDTIVRTPDGWKFKDRLLDARYKESARMQGASGPQ